MRINVYSQELTNEVVQIDKQSNTGVPVALLDWSLDVSCPKCEESNDLSASAHDSEYRIAKLIFTSEWEKLKGWEVTCEHCGHEFTISGVEY